MRHLPFRLPQPGFIAREGGQSVVLVALLFTVLMAGGAMGIDVGRFYAERRFVQSAVDAAALACALSYTRGGTAIDAWNAANDVLQQRNLQHDPLGLAVTYMPMGAETYDDNIALPTNLNSGILPVQQGCRVAVTVAVPTYLIKVVSPALNTISMTARAYAKAKGGFLPSVVKRYLNPGDVDDDPSDDGVNEFVDTTAQELHDSACSVGSNYAPNCVPSTLTAPGREIVLFGASQKADNDSSFRGYIGLDVRNFEDATPPNTSNLNHDSYNGVPANATVNTLKDYEAAWIGQGYPGPDICVVDSTTFRKCAQIAVINGSSSGVFVDWYNQYFHVGDIALFQLYDGTVKSVPDFTFTPPALTVPTSGAVPSKTLPYSMSSQFAATASQICTDIVWDNGTLTYGPGDTTGRNPFNTGAIATNNTNGHCAGVGVGNFNVNWTPPYVTSYAQTWSGMTAAGAQQGIYQVFVRGQATAPYTNRVHALPVKVVVGGQATEYDIASSQSQQSVTLIGLPATVSWNLVVASGHGSTQWHTGGAGADGPITVSWEGCPRSDDPTPVVLTCYIDTLGNTTKTVTADTNVSVSVQTTGVASQKSYYGWIRTTASDSAGHPVVKLWQIRLDVDQQTGGTTQYVDVIGYAAYRITRMDSNDVWGRSVTGAYLDPNDPRLAVGKKIVLVPWETP